MKASVALRRLGDCVSRIEATGYEVQQITDPDGLIGDENPGATLTVDVTPLSAIEGPDDATLTVADAFVNDDGTLQVELEITLSESEGEPDDTPSDADESEEPRASTDLDDVTGDHDGTESATDETDDEGTTSPNTGESEADDRHLEEAPAREEPADPGTSKGEQSTSEAEDRSEDPAYKDPDQLRAVYESHETFAEMTEALGVDVTPQTVRKYMIRYDIHEPSSQPLINQANDRSGESDTTNDPRGGSEDSRAEQGESTVDPEESRTDSKPDDQRQVGENESTDMSSSIETPDPHEPSPSKNPGSDTRDESASSPDDSNSEVASGDETTTDENPSKTEGRTAEMSSESVSLPEGVSLEAVKIAVQKGETLYDVQRDLDLDREVAHRLLEDLNLLDLVHRRGTEVDSDTPIETIESRLHSISGD